MSGIQGTPESEAGSFECFQNYTAPEVFVQGLAGIVDQQDVEAMIRAQKQMLQRFEKTNEMLINCNQLSINRLKNTGAEFKKHTALLVEMKKDLDYIFKKIRQINTKLGQQYPQAFHVVKGNLAEEVIVEDSEDTGETKAGTATVNEAQNKTAVEEEEQQFPKLKSRPKRENDSSPDTDNEAPKTIESSSYSSSDTG